MTLSVDGLRLLQAIASRNSVSAAAGELGYTQSGASRQLAALERSAGARLVDRGPRGASLTAAGTALLPHAIGVLDALARAERVVRGDAAVPELRLGSFPSADVALVPRAVASLARQRNAVRVRTREASSPASIRSVTSGRLDAAIVTTRPPHHPLTADGDRMTERVIGSMELALAVAATDPLAARGRVLLHELEAASWVGPASSGGDPRLGVWPSYPGRPDIRYRSDDWLAKLQLVAAGLAVTTVPPIVMAAAPAGIVVLPVVDAPPEIRRLSLVGGQPSPAPLGPLVTVLREVFAELVDIRSTGRT